MTRYSLMALAKPMVSAGVLILLASCASQPMQVAEPVMPTGLNPEKERISDEAINADLGFIQSLHQRLKSLNDRGHPIDEYSFCKAQAWTDLAYEEYTNNDRSGVVEAALEQAAYLIQRMEARDPHIPMDTPVIRGSEKVRNDLWSFAEETKRSGTAAKICSAACALAKMEVQTVWAGAHERLLGWRYAESQIHAAERYQREVVTESPNCPMAATAAVAAEPHLPLTRLGVPTLVHFAFDQIALSDATQGILARAAQVLRDHPEARVSLTGFADVRGTEPYNERLGARRADSVRGYLVATGISPNRVSVHSAGESSARDADRRRGFALARRVELQYSGLDGLELEPQMIDLQPDR